MINMTPHSEKKMITVVCPWYYNTSILEYQLNAWNALPDELKDQAHFIVVDDGSPQKLQLPQMDLNFSMARINKDIPWNQPGARNLGAFLADTEFVLFTDIDHEITADALGKAIVKEKDPGTVYMFPRIFNGKQHPSHQCSFVIHKQAFERIGGFDEDFSGHRGHDDSLMRYVIDRNLKRGMIDGILILHGEAMTTCIDRDHKRNALLLESKLQELLKGTYRNGRLRRFEWEVVHQTRRAPLNTQPKRSTDVSTDKIESVLDKLSAPIIHNKRLGEIIFSSMSAIPHLRGPYDKPDHLEIITAHNYPEKSLFEKSLDYLGIDNYTVLQKLLKNHWRNTLKLKWVLGYLESTPNGPENVLFCDADDCILVGDPWDIVKIFNQSSVQLLFMSTSFMGGYACMPQVKQWADRIQFGRYLNSGVYVGKRKFLIKVLREANQYITDDDITEEEYVRLGRGVYNKNLCERLPEYPKGSQDQDILRYIHPQFYPDMQIDWDNALAFRNL